MIDSVIAFVFIFNFELEKKVKFTAWHFI